MTNKKMEQVEHVKEIVSNPEVLERIIGARYTEKEMNLLTNLVKGCISVEGYDGAIGRIREEYDDAEKRVKSTIEELEDAFFNETKNGEEDGEPYTLYDWYCDATEVTYPDYIVDGNGYNGTVIYTGNCIIDTYRMFVYHSEQKDVRLPLDVKICQEIDSIAEEECDCFYERRYRP